MTQKKRILIFGSGISGLTTALSLKKNGFDCVLLEQEEEVGGCMKTREKEGLFFEQGPRVFKASRCLELLTLIKEVGLESELVFSKKGLSRYLWADGRLRKMPQGFLEILFSPFFRPLLYALMTEWKKQAFVEDETIWQFGCRRFGQVVTERFLDPLILGIYAGDIKQLSVGSCLTGLKQWEQKYGSITKGWIHTCRHSKKDHSLFSLRKGSRSLTQALVKQIDAPVLCGHQVLTCEKRGSRFFVATNKGLFEGDAVVIALPAREASRLLIQLAPSAAAALREIPYVAVTVVNVVLEGALPVTGFGYLVPSFEEEDLLGVLFDSDIFPQESPLTKITLMIRGVKEQKEIEAVTNRVLDTHLKVMCSAKIYSSTVYAEGIPQYLVGHDKQIDKIRADLLEGVYLVGNYLEGVSVNDCVKLSQKVASDINTAHLSR